MLGRGAVVLLSACSFAPSPAATDGNTGVPADGTAIHDAAPDAPGVTHDAAVTGSLTVTVTTLDDQDINLTSEGTLDWAHWGRSNASSFDHKASGSSISNLTHTPPSSFTGAPLTSSWSDGTPTSSSSKTTTGVAATLIDNAFVFTVPAGTTPHILKLYAGAQLANGRLDVSLSDGSAPSVSKTLSSPNDTTNVSYTITFNAAASGQTLTVSWQDTMDFDLDNAFAALLSATLQ